MRYDRTHKWKRWAAVKCQALTRGLALTDADSPSSSMTVHLSLKLSCPSPTVNGGLYA